jgi:hypothetical protein
MKRQNWIKRAAIYAATAISMAVLLAACATAGPNTADGCVGPPEFCNPYFGS